MPINLDILQIKLRFPVQGYLDMISLLLFLVPSFSYILIAYSSLRIPLLNIQKLPAILRYNEIFVVLNFRYTCFGRKSD